MTNQQAQQYILEQLDIVAQHRYPNRKDLQNQFKIGFLTGQLTTAMLRDNYTYYAFRECVHRLGYTEPLKRR